MLHFASICASLALISRAAAGITTDPTALNGNTYTYVVVGGGGAGLALANRLSANPNNTVAVIEAGGSGYDAGQSIENRLLSPGLAYSDGLTGSQYDWQFKTTAQSQLNGRSIAWPRGKILGGSTAINGLYLVQASQEEYEAWASLIGDSNWGWAQTAKSRRKSQNYGAEPQYVATELGMVQNLSAWGEGGPIHFSFPPPLEATQEDAWIPSFANLGIPTADPGAGHTINAIASTVAVNPTNYTRSYSYTGYLVPVASRSNLHVLSGYTATRILFNGTTAVGVNYAASQGATTYSVNAANEVILSAGVVGSPQLLLVSGVGPAATLSANGIAPVVALPGVGQGLREHLSASTRFDVTGNVQYAGDMLRLNSTFAAEQLSLWQNGDPSQSLYSVSNHMIGMLNLSTVLGSSAAAASYLQQAIASVPTYAAGLGDPTVQAGYQAVSNAETSNLMPGGAAVIEILQANTQGYGSDITMGIQAGLQRPFSRGTLTINSASIFDKPTIDPGYLTNSNDLPILVAAFQFIRQLSQTDPISNLINSEINPGLSTNTYDEWASWLATNLATEYSPFGTCAMLPLSLGGVVDAQLNVYGTQNLRVVDASIIPVNIAAHGTAPTYALAETAAQIILGSLPPAPISSTSTSSSTASNATSPTTSPSNATVTTGIASAVSPGSPLPLASILRRRVF